MPRRAGGTTPTSDGAGGSYDKYDSVARGLMPMRSLSDLLPDLGRRTLVMGIVNVTPDSFSGDGRLEVDAALAYAARLAADGADILDVGGESTRPGAAPVSADEEMRRVLPVISGIAETIPLSISLDTTKAVVAQAGIAAGAHLINDISGGTFDPDLLRVVSEAGVPVCLMHLPIAPQQMGWSRAAGTLPPSADVIVLVIEFLRARIQAAEGAGIARQNILIDPGFGFGKSVAQNLRIVRNLAQIKDALGCPLLLGVSRKSTIGRVLGDMDAADPERLAGGAAAVALGIAGGADIIRVHDAAFMTRVARMSDAVCRAGYLD